MIIVKQYEPSVSGQDNVTYQGGFVSLPTSFDEKGFAKIIGNLSDLGATVTYFLYAIQTLTKTPYGDSELFRICRENKPFLHWSDLRIIMQILLNPINKGVNAYTTTYKAGGRVVNETQLFWFIVEVKNKNQANILWDYNTQVQKWIDDDLAKDKVKGEVDADPYNPDNPTGFYYSPEKKVIGYDKENGYIIYADGKIIFTKTGGVYFDALDGGLLSYDKEAQTVTYALAGVLNLKTLVFTNTKGETKTVVTVKNELAWWQKVISNTRLLIGILAAIVILIILKKKRNG